MAKLVGEAILRAQEKQHRDEKIAGSDNPDEPEEPEAMDFAGIEHAAKHGMPKHFGLLTTEQVGELFVTANLLRARYDKEAVTNEPFVALAANGIKWMRENSTGIAEVAMVALNSSSDWEWALAIDAIVPEPVKALLLSPEPPSPEAFRRLDPIESRDFGVYACMLFPPSPAHHHHIYVGSATGRNGLRGRMGMRDASDIAKTERNFFHNLLKDGKGREALWVTLGVIPGSQDTQDVAQRTYHRFIVLLLEGLFHCILGTWKAEERNGGCLWAAKAWLGTNSSIHPLNGRAVVASYSADLRKAMSRAKDRLRMRVKAENRSTPERLAHNAQAASNRHAREAAETADQREERLQDLRVIDRARYAAVMADQTRSAARKAVDIALYERKEDDPVLGPQCREKRQSAYRAKKADPAKAEVLATQGAAQYQKKMAAETDADKEERNDKQKRRNKIVRLLKKANRTHLRV